MLDIDENRYYKEVVESEKDHPSHSPFLTDYGRVSTQGLSKYAVGATTSLALLTGEGNKRITEASTLHDRVLKEDNPESLRGEVTELLANTWDDLGFPAESSVTGCRGLLEKIGDYNNDYYSRHLKEHEREDDDGKESQDGAALTAESGKEQKPLQLADDEETREREQASLIKNTVPSGTLLHDQRLSVEGAQGKDWTE